MTEPELFSAREKEVIALLLQGKSNKQIALELGIAQRTVEFHLSNIYAKLGVTSRTEAALKLNDIYLRESTGGELRKSTVAGLGESDDNVNPSISSQRIPMKKSFLIGLGLLIATTAFCLVSIYIMAKDRAPAQETFPSLTSTTAATFTAPTDTRVPTVSPKEHILDQIRQLAAEYDQAVQAEKQNGDIEFSKDPTTGEELFHFNGDSYERISNLLRQLDEQIFQLYQLYNQVYRDEANSTPFPTQASPEQSESYYEFLIEQTQELCPIKELDLSEATVMIYDPDDGKYRPWIINDEIARCDVYGKMIEEWYVAPILEKVNREADMTMIRQIMGKPNLQLNFDSISGAANAPGRNAALYADETGAKYYVDVETARLAQIEPNFPSHPNMPDNEKKSMVELRGIARQFASTNSPRLAELESVLLYEEACKNDICFFRWDYRNKDWSGTDWIMMPPFLQVGVLADGQVVTYKNTLDLFE
ncbi:MAG: helix-turn-helix transcriptional regulator [Anaerolineales bacterium]